MVWLQLPGRGSHVSISNFRVLYVNRDAMYQNKVPRGFPSEEQQRHNITDSLLTVGIEVFSVYLFFFFDQIKN